MFAPTHPLHLVYGLLIWCIWFVLIYSVLSLGCAFALPENTLSPINWLNGIMLLLTLIITALLAGLANYCWRARAAPGNPHFTARLAAGLYLVAAIATLAVGLPVLVLPPCL